MPRPCSICVHPKRIEIETELNSGSVTQSEIAQKYGMSAAAVTRHKPHMVHDTARDAPKIDIPEIIAEAEVLSEAPVTDVVEVSAGQSAYYTLLALKSKAEKGLEAAEHAENATAMGFWFKELRNTLELIFKVGLAQKQFEDTKHRDISPELQSRIDQVIGG